MKRLIQIALIFVVSLPVFATEEGTLPGNWYQLPEDANYSSRADWERETAPNATAVENIERLLKSHSSGLDGISNFEKSSRIAKGDWNLAALILDLTVSASGALGVLMAKGEATASLYWRRVQQTLEEQHEDGGSDLILSGEESRSDVEAKLEPIIRATLATGEVNDAPEFRRNLLNTVMGYQGLIQDVGIDPGREWYVSKLRLDFSVDISGKVNPVTTVGGGIRLRFEWEPATDRVPHARFARHRGADELGGLLETLRQTLQKVSYADLGPTGFTIKSLKFGLGLYGEGKFGVVKVGASVMGHLYLAKRTIVHPVAETPGQALPAIPLIEIGNDTGHAIYATANGISHQTWNYRGGRGAVYQIPVEMFRKGLEKAIQIGSYLAERSNRSKGKNWELYQLKTEFALSLAGTVGLVTIGGTGALELVFVKAAAAPLAQSL